jgi:penicillin amidase
MNEEPASGTGAAEQPEGGEPAGSELEGSEPEGDEPEGGEPEGGEPVSGEPVSRGPEGDAAVPATEGRRTVRGSRPRRRRRLLRVWIWSLAVILVLAVAATLTGTWEVRRTFAQYDGALRVPGLTGNVTVYRDSYAIPQVYAGNADDLFIAQGYLASQERFYQMDFDRHITSATLSEMFGSGQLSTDEYLREMDWHGVAQREWDIISPQSREYLTDFAKGVNDYLAQHSKDAVSLEYTVLGLQNHGYTIAPWSPIDSLAWLKALAWDLLGNMNDEIARATLLASGLGREQVESLYPAYPYARNAPIVADGGSVAGGAFTAGTPATAATTAADETLIPPAALPALRAVQSAIEGMPTVAGPSLPGTGSNSWVVSGALTTTGKPILANDPHLAPSMPSIWYQMGLHCTCGFNVEGFTFPDMPGVIIGHNSQIAWGFTNLDPDVSDLYLEKVKGNDYEVDGQWVPLSIRTTTIKVAGGRPVTLTVRSTNNGPLLSDVSDDLKNIANKPDVDPSGDPTATASAPPDGVTYAVALKWTALQPGTTMDALFAVDQAGDWDQFREAARHFDVPSQNMVYADVHGNIGYQSPGLIPIRGKGDGRWPAPGWDSAYDWTGYIPFDQLPSEDNPPDGYFATANQAVINPDTYQPFLTDDWSYGYRSQRIADMITTASAGGKKISTADVASMQFDTRNDFAAQIVPTLLTEHVTGATARAGSLLRDWDFQQPADGASGTPAAKDSAAAAYFNQFWHDLVALTFDELPAADRPDGGDRWFVVFDNLFQDARNAWWDDRSTPRTETRDDIVTEAMNQASAQLAKAQGSDPAGWRWGATNRLTIENQSLGTSGIGPIEWLFNYGPVGVPGGCDIVVATCSDLSKGFGTVGSVPSMRMIVDMSNLDSSRWVQLVGESGHAFSAHYHDQFDLWLTGKTLPMPWDEATIRRAARDTLTLTP